MRWMRKIQFVDWKSEIEKEMENEHQYFGIRIRGKIVGLYKASIRGDGCFGEHQSIHPEYRGRMPLLRFLPLRE